MTSNKTLSLLLFVSMVIACLNPLGKEAFAGGFSRSCTSFRLVTGRFLYAECKDRNGNFRPQSSLDLMDGVGNRDGYLGIGKGFLNSCRNLRSDEIINITAECRTYNGGWRTTTLNVDSIVSNNDGNLTFDR